MEDKNIALELIESLDNITSLRDRTDMLSIESGFINKVASYVTNGLSSIKDTFNNNYNKLLNLLETSKAVDISTISKNSRKIGKDIKDIKFSDVDSRPTPVTFGMRTDLIIWNDVVKDSIDELDKNTLKHLDEVTVILSKILSDESYRKTFKPSNLDVKHIDKINSSLMDNIEKLIDHNSMVDRLPVGKVIPNLASLTNLTSDTALLAKDIKNNNLSIIAGKVKVISDKTDMLYDYMTNDKVEFTITKNSITALADALDSSARLVTVYSSIYSMANQQVGMVNNLIEIIKKR